MQPWWFICYTTASTTINK